MLAPSRSSSEVLRSEWLVDPAPGCGGEDQVEALPAAPRLSKVPSTMSTPRVPGQAARRPWLGQVGAEVAQATAKEPVRQGMVAARFASQWSSSGSRAAAAPAAEFVVQFGGRRVLVIAW